MIIKQPRLASWNLLSLEPVVPTAAACRHFGSHLLEFHSFANSAGLPRHPIGRCASQWQLVWEWNYQDFGITKKGLSSLRAERPLSGEAIQLIRRKKKNQKNIQNNQNKNRKIHPCINSRHLCPIQLKNNTHKKY